MTRRHIAIVGAGQAGLSVAMNLRQKGFEGKLTLIGDEVLPPYQRPPLSKAYLLGKLDQDRMLLRPRAYYDEHGIELQLDLAVQSLDLTSRELVFENGRLPFDELVLATGSAPRHLSVEIGGDLDGVFYLRSHVDAERLTPHLIAGRKLVMIGGGYIGLEVAAVACVRGLEVTVVEAGARILQRVAASETSSYFRDLHRSRGVCLIEGVGLRELRGQGHVCSAELTDGRVIEADVIVVGIGVTPRIALAEGAGIVIDNGIRVDSHGRTSAEGVWAVGDCCSFPYRGQSIRLESVPNAVDQGAVVAANLLGGDEKYQARPWFWSDQYDVKLQTAGLSLGYDRTFVRPSPKGPLTTSVWYFIQGQAIAVDAMNDPRTYMAARRFFQQGRPPSFAEVSHPDFVL